MRPRVGRVKISRFVEENACRLPSEGLGRPALVATDATRTGHPSRIVSWNCYFRPKILILAVNARLSKALNVRKLVESTTLFTKYGFRWSVMLSKPPRSA